MLKEGKYIEDTNWNLKPIIFEKFINFWKLEYKNYSLLWKIHKFPKKNKNNLYILEVDGWKERCTAHAQRWGDKPWCYYSNRQTMQ